MRDAMSADDHDEPGLYLGARNGSVWGSFDRRRVLARAGARTCPT